MKINALLALAAAFCLLVYPVAIAQVTCQPTFDGGTRCTDAYGNSSTTTAMPSVRMGGSMEPIPAKSEPRGPAPCHSAALRHCPLASSASFTGSRTRDVPPLASVKLPTVCSPSCSSLQSKSRCTLPTRRRSDWASFDFVYVVIVDHLLPITPSKQATQERPHEKSQEGKND